MEIVMIGFLDYGRKKELGSSQAIENVQVGQQKRIDYSRRTSM
jgi:hypothetical protein